MNKGDFNVAFAKYLNEIKRQSSFIINNDVSEDLVSRAYIKSINSVDSYIERGLFVAWITSIMRRIYLTDLKYAKRIKTIQLSELLKDENFQIVDNRCIIDEMKGERNRFLLALKYLTPKYKKIIILRVYDCESYASIATSENITVGAAKTRFRLAKIKIKNIMQGV